MLFSFLECIENCARQNYIYEIPEEFGGAYKIKYHNIGYRIGYAIGQGSYVYCQKIEDEDLSDCMDFNFIMEKKIINPNRNKLIKEELQNLKNIVLSLKKLGIPERYIQEETENILSESNEKQIRLK